MLHYFNDSVARRFAPSPHSKKVAGPASLFSDRMSTLGLHSSKKHCTRGHSRTSLVCWVELSIWVNINRHMSSRVELAGNLSMVWPCLDLIDLYDPQCRRKRVWKMDDDVCHINMVWVVWISIEVVLTATQWEILCWVFLYVTEVHSYHNARSKPESEKNVSVSTLIVNIFMWNYIYYTFICVKYHLEIFFMF